MASPGRLGPSSAGGPYAELEERRGTCSVEKLLQLDPGSAREPHVAGPHPRAHVPAPPPAAWASASFSFKEKALPPPFGLRSLPLSSGCSCPGSPWHPWGAGSRGLALFGAH